MVSHAKHAAKHAEKHLTASSARLQRARELAKLDPSPANLAKVRFALDTFKTAKKTMIVMKAKVDTYAAKERATKEKQAKEGKSKREKKAKEKEKKEKESSAKEAK